MSKGAWKNHKYETIIDGVYYYPKSYKDGKYSLPDGKSETSKKNETLDDISEEEKAHIPKDWTKTFYEEIDKVMKNNPDFNPYDMVGSQDFRLTLAEFAGIEGEYLSEDTVDKMKEIIRNHYKDYKTDKSDDDSEGLTDEDIDDLAMQVIRGTFGNGQDRKDLLGEDYSRIQERVNELMRGMKGTKKGKSKSSGSSKKNSVKFPIGPYSGKPSDKKNKQNQRQKQMSIGDLRKDDNTKLQKAGRIKHSEISRYDDMLMHFGMPRRSGRYPWGTGDRPYQSIGGISNTKSKDSESELKEANKIETKKRLQDSKYRRTLSKESLKEKIQRLEDEKKLRNLTEEEITPAKRFVNAILSDSGKRIATTMLTGAGLYATKSILSGSFNRKEFAEALFYGGPKTKGKK